MGREWTKEEESFLVKEYPERSFAEIGKILDRTRAGIKNKYQSLKYASNFTPEKQENLMKPNMTTRPMAADEEIPLLPGLLDHLMSMAGSMNSEIVAPNARHRQYMARIELVRPQLDEMLGQGISGYKIAQAIGVPHSTVYGYIKDLRAAA